MSSKRKYSIFSALIAVLLITSMVSAAEYPGKQMGTAYQLVNTGDSLVDITVQYYDSNGAVQTAATRSYKDVEIGGSRLVIVPKDETNLTGGSYSAVVSSSGPIAGIVNEEYYPTGTTSATPPFASYSTVSDGSNIVNVPVVMYNYYGIYTELFIQNVGGGDATDVKIEYLPATQGGVLSGKLVTETALAIKQYATLYKSQQNMTGLGGVTAPYVGAFFGSARISSVSTALAVVVNQHNIAASKLLSYNGVGAGSTKLISPVAMRGWFTYFTSLTVQNLDTANPACVKLTYYPDTGSNAANMKLVGQAKGTGTFVPVTKQYALTGGGTLLRVENTTSKSDLAATYDAFTGSVTVESIIGTVSGVACTAAAPLVAIMNVESTAGVGFANRAGSFNLVPASAATNKVVAPVILANFYGLYTTMNISNTTATTANCSLKYTSSAKSAVGAGITHTYPRELAGNGSMMIYEGKAAGTTDPRSDISRDTATWTAAGSSRFIGSVEITCVDKANPATPVAIVATVNEENNLTGTDAMYTMNTINK